MLTLRIEIGTNKMQIIVPIFILGVCKMVILVVHWDWAELCPVAPSSAISNVPAWAAAKWPSMTNSGYSECASALDNKNYPNLHNNEHGCLGIHPSGPFPPKALFVIHGVLRNTDAASTSSLPPRPTPPPATAHYRL